jgi:hypothetical protein
MGLLVVGTVGLSGGCGTHCPENTVTTFDLANFCLQSGACQVPSGLMILPSPNPNTAALGAFKFGPGEALVIATASLDQVIATKPFLFAAGGNPQDDRVFFGNTQATCTTAGGASAPMLCEVPSSTGTIRYVSGKGGSLELYLASTNTEGPGCAL